MDHEQMLVKFECRKCKKDFGSLESSCGLGWSWGLYRCPHCHQLHAMAFIGGFIPDEVLNDKEIIVIESFRPTPVAGDAAGPGTAEQLELLAAPLNFDR